MLFRSEGLRTERALFLQCLDSPQRAGLILSLIHICRVDAAGGGDGLNAFTGVQDSAATSADDGGFAEEPRMSVPTAPVVPSTPAVPEKIVIVLAATLGVGQAANVSVCLAAGLAAASPGWALSLIHISRTCARPSTATCWARRGA